MAPWPWRHLHTKLKANICSDTQRHTKMLCVCVCAAHCANCTLTSEPCASAKQQHQGHKHTHKHAQSTYTHTHIHSRTSTLFPTPVWLDEISSVIQGASWRRRRQRRPLQSASLLEFFRRHLINPRTFVETFYFPTMALIAKASRLKVPRQGAWIFAQATG